MTQQAAAATTMQTATSFSTNWTTFLMSVASYYEMMVIVYTFFAQITMTCTNFFPCILNGNRIK